jgi:hypothetical protein
MRVRGISAVNVVHRLHWCARVSVNAKCQYRLDPHILTCGRENVMWSVQPGSKRATE